MAVAIPFIIGAAKAASAVSAIYSVGSAIHKGTGGGDSQLLDINKPILKTDESGAMGVSGSSSTSKGRAFLAAIGQPSRGFNKNPNTARSFLSSL